MVDGQASNLSRMSPRGYRIACCALLAVLALSFFADLLRHPLQVLYSDHSDLLAMHLPAKRFLVRSWQETGTLPLWCPHSFAGMAFIHDIQVAPFYPPHALLYLLPESGIGAALSWLIVLHVLVAGWGMFAYALHRGLGTTAALCAAIGTMFAGKWLLHLLVAGHYVMIGLAWLPLCALFMERAIATGRARWALAAGASFGLIVLGTHPQMTFYAGLFLALWTAGQALECAGLLDEVANLSRGRALARWLATGLVTVVVAVSLGAVELLPALEAAPLTTRGVGIAADEALRNHPSMLRGLIGPALDGVHWESGTALGVLWVVLALAAGLGLGGRARFELTVTGLLLAFACGGGALVQHLPGFRYFQLPGRIAMFLAMPIALLAARMVDRLLQPGTMSLRFQRRQFLLAGLVLVFVAVVAGSTLATGHRLVFHPYWIVLAGSLPAFLWLVGRNALLQRPAFRAALVILLLLDGTLITRPYVEVRPETVIYPVSGCVGSILEQCAAAAPDRPRVWDRGLVGQPGLGPLGVALPLLAGSACEPIQGYNSFDVVRTKQFLQCIAGKGTEVRPRDGIFGHAVLPWFPIENKPLLDLFGVRFVLQPANGKPIPPGRGEVTCHPTWRRLGEVDRHAVGYSFLGGLQQFPPMAIYENTAALPRVLVAAEAVRLPSDAKALDALTRTDFRRTVLVEDAEAGAEGNDFRYLSGSARIAVYAPNRVVVEAEADGPAWLVLHDVWFPGWRATVNGESTPIRRANYLFRAVPIGPGQHTVVFEFAPRSYEIGRLISLGTLGVLLVFGGLLILKGVTWKRA